MTKFADQLYADLMREHGPVLAAARPPAASQRHIASRRVLLATGAGGLAVATAAGALAVAAGGGTPAASGGAPSYALTTNHDGTVTLAVYRTPGIAQANAKLHQLGDNVVVVPVRPGCPAIGSLPAPAVPQNGGISVQSGGPGGGSVTVNAKGIPAGDILVVGVETSVHGREATSEEAARLTSPPAPACVSLPSPPAPPPLPGNGGHGAGTAGGSGGRSSLHGVYGGGSGPNVSGPNVSSNS
jgi:hypothetical protein